MLKVAHRNFDLFDLSRLESATKKFPRGWKDPQWVSAPVLTEDMGSIHNTHLVAHDYP